MREYGSGKYRDYRVLVRGRVTGEVFTAFERSGVPHINTRFCRDICDDKTVTARFLAENRWPAPRTLGIIRRGQRMSDEDSWPYPVIAKPVSGSRGRGVTLLGSPEEFLRFADGLRRDSPEDYLIQEYLSFSPGRDIRVFVCGGRILAAVERQGDGILSNSSSGGTARLFTLPPEYRKLTLEIAEKAELHYGTVDFIWKNRDELAVCELNASPGFEELEKQTGTAVAEQLLAFVSSF